LPAIVAGHRFGANSPVRQSRFVQSLDLHRQLADEYETVPDWPRALVGECLG
jgi:hypothetical protein